ncbi:hypothetical protein [Actinomadura miaoliensis]|uniref:Class III extradiol dioxygenase subunit B-like domain-containing protein n=1 Tax=Actinomadura miaoliensis TaxID=430685 RepID=A0ABP7W2T9_9ACTN
MLVSAAVCPHPPLLVPEMAGAAAGELDALREACDEAVRRLAGDVLVVVGGDARTWEPAADGVADFRPYGLDLTFGTGRDTLPLSLAIGHWLLRRARGVPPVRYQAVAFDASPQDCLALGERLAGSAERVALLVMGDGSACRDVKAPGYLDDRAEPFDEAAARALGGSGARGPADTAALAALDPSLAADLWAAGRAAWQVLAGAAGAAPFTAELLAHEAPYGVGYLVASWKRD